MAQEDVTMAHRAALVVAWLAGVFLLALALLVGVAIRDGVIAHSFYDHSCCSDQDCYPVAVDDVIETETGWKHLPTGTEFTKEMVKPSKDHRFHVCIGNSDWNRGTPYCIYILQGA